MKIYDVTLTMRPDMPVWPGDHPVELYRDEKIEEGANANVSILSISVHTGTHVDSPYHFLNDGTAVDVLPLEVLIGPVQVVELTGNATVIDAHVVENLNLLPGIERLLFKTRNSDFWSEEPQVFHPDFVGIDEAASRILVDKGIKLVGIDYLSIAPFKKSRPTHEVFLKAKVVLIEGLNLTNIHPGKYTLYCLPLKLKNTDGAPARTILIED